MKPFTAKAYIRSALCTLLLFLCGCEKLRVEPVSVQGQPIVGHWYAQQSSEDDGILVQRHVYLQVREDGYARYFSLLCETNLQTQSTSSRNLQLDYTPIKRLNHKKMLLQRYPLTPQFELTIEHWPEGRDDQFEVDEIQLQWLSDTEVPEFSAWSCDEAAQI